MQIPEGFKYEVSTGVRELFASGKPVTQLEALLLFGMSNLSTEISNLRKKGWVIRSKRVPYARAVRRVNEFATFEPPSNLPTREIMITEYWLEL